MYGFVKDFFLKNIIQDEKAAKRAPELSDEEKTKQALLMANIYWTCRTCRRRKRHFSWQGLPEALLHR